MSDFQFNADVLRGQMAEALLYADEDHTMWVVAEFAERADPKSVENLAACFQPHEHDRSEVVAFLRNLADLIEAEGKSV
ncbi:hypothetical protein GTA62_12940 [Roseobacter sp. HKCCD9010]|uniref:hypothetical protein n=1 Tax=unclassified Roseobacter TaxID=196798 RepID=UPI001490AF6B|nr:MULTISPECIES: hypothetical protein [unclassified Roseobacter]MBF9049910.1 hypothetical protein [Rhodobacterales bacterium HKCCD4356]NNV13551.1 hypothetical protein [Roseobacter sp. HKCCD7357]NNV16385.1 hypothetical protein [Roseobacter sp. HKCCD8768]NNV25844.1 hypothetical protein [Roseobacter sp. HKCCD8192]NNV30102.1 hypothetical protein [Roseobacter sp. HKCCD9061]